MRFALLSRGEKQLCLRAFSTVVRVRLALSLRPSSRVLRSVEEQAKEALRNPRSSRFIPPDRVAWAVRAASRCVPRATCLTQALAGRFLLAQYGHPSTVRIGVARNDAGEFEAHAWSEVEGRAVIGDRGVERYRSLPDLREVLGR